MSKAQVGTWNSAIRRPGSPGGPVSEFGLGMHADDRLMFMVLLSRQTKQGWSVERAESYSADQPLRRFAARVNTAYRLARDHHPRAALRISACTAPPQGLEHALRAELGPLFRYELITCQGDDAAERACCAALPATARAVKEMPRLAARARQRAAWFA